MPLRVHCNCGKTYDLPDKFSGKMVRCKACGEDMRVDPDTAESILPGAENAAYESSSNLNTVDNTNSVGMSSEELDNDLAEADDDEDFELIFNDPEELAEEPTQEVPPPQKAVTKNIKKSPTPAGRNPRASSINLKSTGATRKTGKIPAVSRNTSRKSQKSKRKTQKISKSRRSSDRSEKTKTRTSRTDRGRKSKSEVPMDPDARLDNLVGKAGKGVLVILALLLLYGIYALFLKPKYVPLADWEPTPTNSWQANTPTINFDRYLNIPEDAEAFVPFRTSDGKRWEGDSTLAWLSTDGKALRVVLYCSDNNMQKLNISNADNIFANDSVEVFLAPNRKDAYFQIAVDARGRYKLFHVNEPETRGSIDWSSKQGVKIQTDTRSNGVVYSITIPLARIGMQNLDQGILLQVIRNYRGQSKDAKDSAILMAFPNMAPRANNHARSAWKRADVKR